MTPHDTTTPGADITTSRTAEPPKSVLVIGGGLIGLSCAYFLRAEGLDVTVLDSGSVGGGASRGNLGEVVPTQVTPLSTPGILRDSIGSVFKPDSALYMHPQVSPEMLRFLLRFTRSTRSENFRRAVADLQAFSHNTLTLFEKMQSDGLRLDVNTEGFLFVFKALAAAQASLASQAAVTGANAEVLTAEHIRSLEPNLSDKVAAGYLLKNHWSINPNAFIDGLAGILRRESVSIVESVATTRIETDDRSVKVHTSNGTFEAETCVIAAGIYTRDLCRMLGIDLDIVAGKGYSFSINLPHPLTRTLQFADVHVVATPMGTDVRVAGTMELDRHRERFNPGRVASIVTAAAPYLDGVDWNSRRNEWVGPRPMTGDGMPIIGPLPGHPRVIVSSGHNMHGLTLAPATGRMVADLVATGGAGAHGNPFDPSRAGRSRRWNRNRT